MWRHVHHGRLRLCNLLLLLNQLSLIRLLHLWLLLRLRHRILEIVHPGNILSIRMIPYDATQEQYESIGTMLRTKTAFSMKSWETRAKDQAVLLFILRFMKHLWQMRQSRDLHPRRSRRRMHQGNCCFFNPKLYRIILMDQRGSGRSKPTASLVDNEPNRPSFLPHVTHQLWWFLLSL